MSLKELIEKLKGFDCAALNNKEIVYIFSTQYIYFKVSIEDIIYNATNERFEIITGEPEPTKINDDNVIKYEIKRNK